MKIVEDNYRHKGLRQQMVNQLRADGITDERVLAAINEVPRHVFLDSGQTISQPSTVAAQTSLLSIENGMKVLEIGTGSGYQACVLSAMGAKVFSIERQRNLYLRTKELLGQLHYRVKTFLGDGYEGLPSYKPFDRIIITAGAPYIPPKLIDQLKPNGIMVIPMDRPSGEGQVMVRLTKLPDGTLSREEFGDFKFVPMLSGTASD